MWKRVKGFVASIEKNIDAEFSGNQPAMKVAKNDLEISQLSDDEKIELNFKPEADDESKKQQIKDAIEETQKQTETLNLEFEKLQNVLKEIGDDGILLLSEFETRQRKMQLQISNLNSIEEKLKNEINEIFNTTPASNVSSDEEDKDLDPTAKVLRDCEAEHSLVQSKIRELEQKIKNFENEENKLLSDLKSIEAKEEDVNREIENARNEYEESDKEMKAKIDEKNKKIPQITDRINQLSSKIEQLSLQLGASEIELRCATNEKADFDKQIASKKELIENLHSKLESADLIAEKSNEERRQNKANAMKEFTNKEIKKYDMIRANLREERSELTEMKTEQEERHNQEINSLRSLLNSTEVENGQLHIRLDNFRKTVLPTLTDPLKVQIESLKVMKETSEKAFESYAMRLKEDIAEIDARKSTKEETISEITKMLDLEKNERQKNVFNRISELKNVKEELLNRVSSDNIDKAKVDAERKKKALNDLRNDLEMCFSSQRALNEKINGIKRQEEFEKENLENRMKAALATVAQGRKPTIFARWKELTKNIADLEKEEIRLKKEIDEGREISVLFEQSVELISERQEQVDSVKRAIQSEKEAFKRNLQLLVG